MGANCDENRAGLSGTAKTPESEEPVGTPQTTGCGRSRDVVTFVWERAGRSSILAQTSRAQGASSMFNIFSVHVISLLVAGLSVVAVFVYIPFVSDYAFWFMVAAYVMLAGYR